MNAKSKFISFLLVVDAFFGGYAAGLNSRYVEVIDPSLPPVSPPKPAVGPAKTAAAKTEKNAEKSLEKHGRKKGKKGKQAGKSKDVRAKESSPSNKPGPAGRHK